jgi:hypothetical protein
MEVHQVLQVVLVKEELLALHHQELQTQAVVVVVLVVLLLVLAAQVLSLCDIQVLNKQQVVQPIHPQHQVIPYIPLQVQEHLQPMQLLHLFIVSTK